MSIGDQAKVAAARLLALDRQPYLATALFAAPIRWAPGCRTVAVDQRWRIFADPAVVDRLDVKELSYLLLHLIAHLLREHGDRGAAHDDPAAWNVAADAEVNDDLPADLTPASAPSLPAKLGLPEGGLAEAYYPHLHGTHRPWDCGSGSDGQPRPWERGTGTALTDRDIELLKLAVAAAIHNHEGLEPGTVTGGWLRWAEDILPSKVDWRRVLAAELRAGIHRATGAVDYTYRRPSRRASATPDVVLPALERPVPQIAVICDTSGSMTDHLLGEALSEIDALLTRTGINPEHVRILSCDTAFHTVQRVTNATAVHLVGGGGTDMGAGVTAAATLNPRPNITIILTDGLTPWPPTPPRHQRIIIGLLNSPHHHTTRSPARHHTPPWARVVEIGQ